MLCKNCNEKEAVKYSRYSNGEFCCKECARSFSTKGKRDIISIKVSKIMKEKFASGELRLKGIFTPEAIQKSCETRREKKKQQIDEYINGEYIPGKVGINLIRGLRFEYAGYVCEGKGCVQTHIWNDNYLQHQVHHIDGNSENWNWNNLQCLCPNCHSQTGNYVGKSKPSDVTIFNETLRAISIHQKKDNMYIAKKIKRMKKNALP